MTEEVSKKRSRPAEDEELEIDVNAQEPLSKRAARRLKKGRSLKQAPSSQKPLPREFEDDSSDDDDRAGGAEDDERDDDVESDAVPRDTEIDKDTNGEKKSTLEKKTKRKKSKTTTTTDEESEPKKGTNGIWIGNLSFRTTESDLTTFFTTLRPLGKGKKTSDFAVITASDVVRISLPQGDKRGQNKGFAYIDFRLPEQQETAIALSERILQSRNVLIKPADNFDGRPKPTAAEANAAAADQAKMTKILYVGNLSFDITSADLDTYLGSHAAGLKKVRMATFEDSGKCKGFAFCDFETPEQVKTILDNRKLWTMNGRKLKMEFGQDRSLRRKPPTTNNNGSLPGVGRMGTQASKVDPRSIKPGQALMNAPRASHAIVASKGTKQAFD